jgi:hypothetical protein
VRVLAFTVHPRQLDRRTTVTGKIQETAGWLWGVIRNPPIEWTDTETGELTHTETMTRSTRFHVFRPYWTHVAFTTDPGCGCRKRFGLWATIWCMEHAFESEDD